MRTSRWTVAAVAVWVFRGMAAGYAQEPGFYEQYLQGRLEVGARTYRFSLEDDRRHSRGGYSNTNYRGNFIGSVWGLDEEQNYWPRLYAQYMLIPYFGLGITYDYVRATTVTWANDEETATSSDGDVTAAGPAFYMVGAFPINDRLRPFGELGWAYYFADFEETDHWKGTGPGYRFEVEDTSGILLGVGCSIRVYENWSLEVCYRSVQSAEVDAAAYFKPGSNPGRIGTFPINYDAWSVGVNYRF